MSIFFFLNQDMLLYAEKAQKQTNMLQAVECLLSSTLLKMVDLETGRDTD